MKHKETHSFPIRTPDFLRKIFFFAFFACCLGLAATELDELPLQRLLSPASGEGRLQRLPIDPILVASCRPDFADLRLFHDGKVQPHVVEIRTRAVSREQRLPMPAQALRAEEKDAHLILEVDLSQAGARILEVISPLHDYERLVEISDSADRQHWQALAQGRLCDYRRFLDLAQNEILLPRPAARYLRLDFPQASDVKPSRTRQIVRQAGGQGQSETITQNEESRPFRIDELRFSSLSPVATRETVYDAVSLAFSSTTRRDAQEGRIQTLTFNSGGLSWVELEVDTPEIDFCRPVRLQTEVSPGQWQTLAQGHFSVLGDSSQRLRHLRLTCAAPSSRACRLVIRHGDNQDLRFTSLKARVAARDLMFLSSQEERDGLWLIAYGRADLAAAEYDLASVIAQMPRDAALGWTAGPEMPNPIYRPQIPAGARGFWAQKGLLTAIIILVALCLLLGIRQALKQIDPP